MGIRYLLLVAEEGKNLLLELLILLGEILYLGGYGDVSHELTIQVCILKHAITRVIVLPLYQKARAYLQNHDSMRRRVRFVMKLLHESGPFKEDDLPQVELPLHPPPRVEAVPKEEADSSRLSLEAEIDHFHFEEEEEKAQEEPWDISDSEGNLDKSSAAPSPKLIVARVDESIGKEEEMALDPRRGLRDIMANRNKGSSSKGVPKSQVLDDLPPPLPPTTTLGLPPQS
ncbi:hypothetical protein SO802_000134 [Lithocarpus litseifolius]|uniref:Uncharacterized protein n=1 Tax=Lithocarpus litseifolius TaxID=425828 RepID=A0AAW2DQS8_9ROSI